MPLTQNDLCHRNLGVVTPGLSHLETMPTLSIDLEALTLEENELKFEILCKQVQERSPLESLNSVKSPFLPMMLKNKEIKEKY